MIGAVYDPESKGNILGIPSIRSYVGGASSGLWPSGLWRGHHDDELDGYGSIGGRTTPPWRIPRRLDHRGAPADSQGTNQSYS